MSKRQVAVSLISILSFSFGLFSCSVDKPSEKPNVIFILTDDQGYGDLAFNGNPWIQTPHLDSLYGQSLSFTDFHVGTTCAPSRAGLMTGKYSNKVGVWHTISGREILHENETTLAEVFQQNGYKTSIFGKWHLGDNYPFRPQDRGFDLSFIHKGGGVGQQPDYWNNDYFSDTYFRNGKEEKVDGYCTDVWFSEARKFIDQNADQPFFCYLALNAPHGPYNVPDKYAEPYRGNENIPNPEFYGMITNIDENVGHLRRYLMEKGLAENTLLVFMSDNGTAAGVKFDKDGKVIKGFNAGMKGTKGSHYEGGHRVPFLMHWPAGKLNERKDIHSLTSYIDFLPTLVDLCGLSTSLEVDGISLKKAIYAGEETDRILVVDTQREEYLRKYKQPAVMMGKWRMIGENELYNVKDDPGQMTNVADSHPDLMEKFKSFYESWWEQTSVLADKMTYIPVGKEVPEVVQLNSHDVHMENGITTWNQDQVRSGIGDRGYWPVNVLEEGLYEIELRRWPKESQLGLNDAAPAGDEIPGKNRYKEGVAWDIRAAELQIRDVLHKKELSKTDQEVLFQVNLKKGEQIIEASFDLDNGEKKQAFYAYIKPVK